MERDTHPDAHRVQVELLRRATPAQRIRLARSLSQTAVELSWRGVRRAHPDASDEEAALILVAAKYGRRLAEELRGYLSRRR